MNGRQAILDLLAGNAVGGFDRGGDSDQFGEVVKGEDGKAREFNLLGSGG